MLLLWRLSLWVAGGSWWDSRGPTLWRPSHSWTGNTQHSCTGAWSISRQKEGPAILIRKNWAQARLDKDRIVIITLMRQSRERDVSGAQIKRSLVRWLQRWWRWTGHWRCSSWCWCRGCWTTSVSYEESAHVRQDRADQFGLVCDGYANILHSSGADCPSIAEHLEISEGWDCPADK